MDKLEWYTEPPDGWEIVVGRYDQVEVEGEVTETEYRVLVYDPSEHSVYQWSDGNFGRYSQPDAWCDANEFVRIMAELVLDQ